MSRSAQWPLMAALEDLSSARTLQAVYRGDADSRQYEDGMDDGQQADGSKPIGAVTPRKKNRPFVFPPKRKATTPSASAQVDYQGEMLALRQEQHAAKMELFAAKKTKIEWETAYFRAKYQNEFEQHQPNYYPPGADGQSYTNL